MKAHIRRKCHACEFDESIYIYIYIDRYLNMSWHAMSQFFNYKKKKKKR
jgi:hypothetical protein